MDKHLFDSTELEYITRKGWRVNSAGLLEITKAQAAKEPYIGHSIRDPRQRTLMISDSHGCTLLFEGQHFVIVTR